MTKFLIIDKGKVKQKAKNMIMSFKSQKKSKSHLIRNAKQRMDVMEVINITCGKAP